MKSPSAKIGAKIRAYREKRKVSLTELSRRTGIAASNLSAIELDKSSPTLGTLMKIAEAFGVKAGAFLDEALYRKAVFCSGQTVGRGRVQGEALCESLTHDVALNRMDVRRFSLKAGAGEILVGADGTDRLVYCLDGELAIDVGDERYTLRPSDGLYLLPEASAVLVNQGSGDAIALVVNTPASKHAGP